MTCCKNTVVGLSLLAIGIWLGLCQLSYGQGTLAETTTAIGLQEQINGGDAQPAQKEQAKKPKTDANRPAEPKKPAEPNKPADSNNPAEPNKPAKVSTKPASEANNITEQPTKLVEPNTVVPGTIKETDIPDINDFNSFQKELNRINIETRNEERLWLETTEKKAELAREIDGLAAAQLKFIRKLAETGDANQTVKAIDLVLRQRQERLNKLITKLEDETRQERPQQVERRDKKTNRTSEQKRPRQTNTNNEGQSY